jgi:hypothetical protein
LSAGGAGTLVLLNAFLVWHQNHSETIARLFEVVFTRAKIPLVPRPPGQTSTCKNLPVGSALQTDGRAAVSFELSSCGEPMARLLEFADRRSIRNHGKLAIRNSCLDGTGPVVIAAGCSVGTHLVLVSKFRACLA